MQKHIRLVSTWPFPIPLVALVASMLAAASVGCTSNATTIGQQEATETKQASGAQDASRKTAADAPDRQRASTNTPEAGESAKTAAAEADDAVREPATVQQAAAALDLSTFPALPGAENRQQTVASLSYVTTSDVKSALEFQTKALKEREWKELSEPQVYEQSGSAQFGRDGFHISVSVFPTGDEGKVAVHIHNQSNLNLATLPVPPGATREYVFPGIASFTTEASAEETTAALRKLLLDQAWQPYGTAGDSMHFKKNAVQLNARVFAPPAQPGKTSIQFTASQLSTDLPAPPDADPVQYADAIKQLNLDAPGTPDDLVAFYKQALAPAGWKPTTENPVAERFEQFMIFRNPDKDLLTLTLRPLDEQKKTRVTLSQQTAAEVEELDRLAKAQIEAKLKKDEEERNKPKPKVAVALPAAAQDVQAAPNEIEFQLPSGTAKQALDELTKQLKDSGWKAEEPVGDSMAGQLSFKKDSHTISILYVDPGLIPAQITISASGVELERSGDNKVR